MTSVRRLVLFAFVVPALLTPGCRCVSSSAGRKPADELQKKLEADLAQRDAPSPSASAGPSAFDVETRLETLRDNFAAKSWEAVRHDGLALVTADIDDIAKLEVLQMVVEAMREMGDAAAAREFSEKFQKLYQELRDSPRMKTARADRERMNALMNKLKKRGNTDRFAAADGEARVSFRLAEKLRNAGADDVLEETLPDGGTVYFSRSPDAVESRVAAVTKDASVQKEPEFDYYFAIAEKSPPERATSGTPPK